MSEMTCKSINQLQSTKWKYYMAYQVQVVPFPVILNDV